MLILDSEDLKIIGLYKPRTNYILYETHVPEDERKTTKSGI